MNSRRLQLNLQSYMQMSRELLKNTEDNLTQRTDLGGVFVPSKMVSSIPDALDVALCVLIPTFIFEDFGSVRSDTDGVEAASMTVGVTPTKFPTPENGFKYQLDFCFPDNNVRINELLIHAGDLVEPFDIEWRTSEVPNNNNEYSDDEDPDYEIIELTKEDLDSIDGMEEDDGSHMPSSVESFDSPHGCVEMNAQYKSRVSAGSAYSILINQPGSSDNVYLQSITIKFDE